MQLVCEVTDKSCIAFVRSLEPIFIAKNWRRGYKTFFMLNLAEHKIYHAHKC